MNEQFEMLTMGVSIDSLNGRHHETHQRRQKNGLDEIDEKIIAAMPEYPAVISLQEIEKETGISAAYVKSRLLYRTLCMNHPVCDLGRNRWTLVTKKSLEYEEEIR